MVSIDGKTHAVSVAVRADLDECAVGAADAVRLCRGDCLNLHPGYRCANDNNSIPCEYFKTDGWTCLPEERRYYPPTVVNLKGTGTCELTANEGHSFCPLGIIDCIDSPFGPKCRSELEHISEASSSARVDDQHPTKDVHLLPTVDLHILLRKASTDKNLTYLVQKSVPLLQRDVDQWIKTLLDLKKGPLQQPSPTLFEPKDDISAVNLLQSIDFLLDASSTPKHLTGPADLHRNRKSPLLSVSNVMRSVSAILNVFSTLSSEAAYKAPQSEMASEFEIQRKGLVLRNLRLNKSKEQVQNDSILVHSHSNTSDMALIVTIPAEKLEPFVKRTNSTEVTNNFVQDNMSFGASFTNLDSDVYIVHSPSLINLFQLRIASKKDHQKDVSCRVWDMLTQTDNTFDSQTCQTHWIEGSAYECRCVPKRTGTFAVGLVYIMSSKDLRNLKNFGLVITIVNYVCSAVTVVALSLFLFFTRFVGVFRLDQFHIALSLLLGTLVTLFIPHIPEDFEFLCAVLAVLVNYFPLCAFAWKFVFGLNALLMIVTPHLDFNDMFSLRIFYIPVTICAYVGPALIVGFWFGMARQFKSGLGLCIGPDLLGYRWPLLAPITAVVIFNLIVLIIVGFVILRNYLAIRHSRVNKSTHLLVLIQLMLTLGIPYMLIYIQIISPVYMLLILPVGIALTAVFMFLLVAVIDEENRHLLHLFLKNMCTPVSHPEKYNNQSKSSNGLEHLGGATVKSTIVSSSDAFTLSSSDGRRPSYDTNHQYFARARNHFAIAPHDGDLMTGILAQPKITTHSQEELMTCDDFKPTALLVPLDVTQLPAHYFFDPQSPHHATPVIRFESLHDLVMAPSADLAEVGQIVQTPMPQPTSKAPNRTRNTQHFYPKSRKQFVNNGSSTRLANSYYLETANGEL